MSLCEPVQRTFRYLSDLRYGDVVYVETEKNKYQYMVKEAKVVEPTDLTILEPSPASRLTLITCTEWDSESGFYVKRYVVYADLTEVTPVVRPPQGN
jgi:LPXTG-site transpeptidase (sortase) family protein